MADIDDLDNLFEEYESRSRPEDNERASGDETPVVNEGTEEKAPERVPVPVKRVIRNPRLKFNPDRLCGERGIPVLSKHFKNVKFKGKGHEKEDLDKLLSTLNHWCHRLFPSMKFEDCLRQIEKLGKKRPVQTCLHKLRHDMPILSGDFVGDEVEREGDEVEREGDELQVNVETNPEDAFDRLFNEDREQSLPTANFTSTPIRQRTNENILGTSFGSTLTEEQRKRIEYNRTLAIERRKKLASMQSTSTEVNFDNPSSSGLADSQTYNLEENCASTQNAEKVLEAPSEISDFHSLSDSERNQSMKDSEELGLDELMDLVEDDNPSTGNKTESMEIPSDDHVSELNQKPNFCETLNIELSEPTEEMSEQFISESEILQSIDENVNLI